jgi:small subunit ribosomal protein S21
MRVEVRNNNVDRALKVLKRKLSEENVFKDLQKHRFYESKSEKRRRKKRAAIARFRREEAERQAQI